MCVLCPGGPHGEVSLYVLTMTHEVDIYHQLMKSYSDVTIISIHLNQLSGQHTLT